MKATKSHIGRDVAGETCKEQRDRQATLPLLQSDPKLFCVSAWNDNGRPDLVQNATAIYRSEAFSKMAGKDVLKLSDCHDMSRYTLCTHWTTDV